MVSSKFPSYISLIIPVYNGGPAFQGCLESLKLFLPPPDQVATEVIVVADGCTDDSARLAEEFSSTVLKTASPGGPARARNIGARQAQGEILFFIDADVTIHANTIFRLALLSTENKTLAAAIGSYCVAPGAPNFLSQYKNFFHHYPIKPAEKTPLPFRSPLVPFVGKFLRTLVALKNDTKNYQLKISNWAIA